jgi:hypothetical protein
MNSYLSKAVCGTQGVYFLLTGVWPLVSVESFQAVTGRKTDHLLTGDEADHWMLNTISVLIIADAVVFLAAACRRQVSVDVILLGLASAVALSAIDVVYVARGTISAIYLADAAIEAVFIAAWTALLWQSRSRENVGKSAVHRRDKQTST